MKKILILALMAAMFVTACGKKTADEPVAQVMEQSSEPDSSAEAQDETESENQEESSGETENSGETVSPETTEPEEQETEEASGLEEKGAKDSSGSSEPGAPDKTASTSKPTANTTKPSTGSKPSAASTPKPADTPKPSSNATAAQVPAASTPAAHTSCTWDSGTVTTAAGCSSEGVKTFTCTVCGNTKTESIAATGHSYTTDSKAATCTEDGYTKTYCTTCGDVQSETVQKATGHTMVEEWIDDQWYHAATCVSDGTGHFNSCINCEYYEHLPWPALGHEPDAGTVYRAGTCTYPAKLSHKCTRCGCDLEDTEGAKDPNNHEWAYDEEEQVWYCSWCHTLK